MERSSHIANKDARESSLFATRLSAENCYSPAMHLKIKDIRQRKGLKSYELADRMGISKNYLSEVENGKKTFNAERLRDCAAALEVNVFELLDDPDLTEGLVSHFNLMQGLSPENQKQVIDMARFLRDRDSLDEGPR